MSAFPSENALPWSECFAQDDRARLSELKALNWDPQKTLRSLEPLLKTLVTRLQFSSHSRWGVSPHPAQMHSIIVDFLEWMRESKEWLFWEEQWKKTPSPPSLTWALSRSFLRFQKRQEKEQRSHSRSGARLLLELPNPETVLAQSLSNGLLEAFGSLTQNLPQECRLSYQLHLEGLLDLEIAFLLQLPLENVRQHIDSAKHRLSHSSPLRKVS